MLAVRRNRSRWSGRRPKRAEVQVAAFKATRSRFSYWPGSKKYWIPQSIILIVYAYIESHSRAATRQYEGISSPRVSDHTTYEVNGMNVPAQKVASECRRMGHDSMVCAADCHTGGHGRRGSRACVLSVIRGRVSARWGGCGVLGNPGRCIINSAVGLSGRGDLPQFTSGPIKRSSDAGSGKQWCFNPDFAQRREGQTRTAVVC